MGQHWWTNWKRLLRAAQEDFQKIGAFFPSSRFASRRTAAEIPPNAKRVIELGPGPGTVTHAILKHIPPSTELILIEINPIFIPSLRQRFPEQRVWEADILALPEGELTPYYGTCDAVISGIPYSFLPDSQCKLLTKRAHQLLRDEGRFINYQANIKAGYFLRAEFRSLKMLFEPRNLPPYFIWVAEK